jgi:hypothetical protein
VQPVGEGRVLAFGKQSSVFADGVDQRCQPDCVGLWEIVQDVVGHGLLDAGMADADRAAGNLRRSRRRRRKAVVAAPPPVFRRSAGRQIDLVVDDDDVGSSL